MLVERLSRAWMGSVGRVKDMASMFRHGYGPVVKLHHRAEYDTDFKLPQSSQSPCDRYKHACCSYNGSVYILGGRETSSLRDFWKYSVVHNEWTELSCTGEAAPEELEEHSMVAHEGFLYVFGGMLDSPYTRCRCALWVFDVGGTIECPPPLLDGLEEESQVCESIKAPSSLNQRQLSDDTSEQDCSCQSKHVENPTNRKGHSAVVVGSAMLMYGGIVDIKGSSQDFWSLNFDTKAWSLLSGSLGPGPRHSHSAVAYQSCMYIFGGLKGLQEQRDFWKWSSINHTWTKLKNKSGPPRLVGHSAVTYKESMLLFGGGESQNSLSSCLWRYSFSTQTWAQMATLSDSNPPDKIHHCCAGLGVSYQSSTSSHPPSSALQPKLLEAKLRPFKNRCFPAPLTYLGSEVTIELETLSPGKCFENGSRSFGVKSSTEPQLIRSCLTFENRAFRKQWSCTEEELLEEEEEEDITQHLPDLLLVLGGRPYAQHSPISVWQMTLTDS